MVDAAQPWLGSSLAKIISWSWRFCILPDGNIFQWIFNSKMISEKRNVCSLKLRKSELFIICFWKTLIVAVNTYFVQNKCGTIGLKSECYVYRKKQNTGAKVLRVRILRVEVLERGYWGCRYTRDGTGRVFSWPAPVPVELTRPDRAGRSTGVSNFLFFWYFVLAYLIVFVWPSVAWWGTS